MSSGKEVPQKKKLGDQSSEVSNDLGIKLWRYQTNGYRTSWDKKLGHRNIIRIPTIFKRGVDVKYFNLIVFQGKSRDR